MGRVRLQVVQGHDWWAGGLEGDSRCMHARVGQWKALAGCMSIQTENSADTLNGPIACRRGSAALRGVERSVAKV